MYYRRVIFRVITVSHRGLDALSKKNIKLGVFFPTNISSTCTWLAGPMPKLVMYPDAISPSGLN
jgi:hypothetical protein